MAFPDLSAARLTREIRELGYAGAYTAVKRYLAAIRPENGPKPYEVRFETPAGVQAQVDDEPGQKIVPSPDQPPSGSPLPDTRSPPQLPCVHHDFDGNHDCWDGRLVRRSAPEPGDTPVEPPSFSHWEYLIRVDRRQAWEAKPAECLRERSVPPTVHGADQPKDAALPLPPLRPSGHQYPVHPCCVQRSVMPALDLPRTPLIRAADRSRPPGRKDLSWFCASLCAEAMNDARVRPSLCHRYPLAGCRRTRSPIDDVPSFSTHLSLCSAGFHRLHRSYEEIRLLQRRRPVVVSSFPPTAHADPNRSPGVRALNVPPPPPSLPPRSRMDFGRRVCRHAHPTGLACSRVHFRSVLRFA